jgi:type II secretory pathway pseudopilin PulG
MTQNLSQPPTSPQPQKSNNKFLTRLLVYGSLFPVVVFLGLMALRNLAKQSELARQSEATTNIGSILRSQQVYFLDNKRFATSDTELGVKTFGQSYTYQAILPTVPPNSQAADPKAIISGFAMVAIPQKPDLPGLVGVVFADQEGNTILQTCIANAPSPEPLVVPAAPTNSSETISCPPGSSPR